MTSAADWLAIAVFLLGAALALTSAPVALAEAAQHSARAQLERAFDRTFQQPGVRRVALRVERSGRLVAERAFDLAHRREGAGARSLVRFLAPDYLRGHALLLVDGGGTATADVWLYQPEERRPRRMGASQKGDSFYGSDLSFEDLERPRWAGWRVARLGQEEEGGARSAVLDAWPPPDSQYGRLRVWLAAASGGVARIDFFGRAGSDASAGAAPVKQLRVDLAGAVEERGFLRVARIEVEAVGRAARTELRIVRMTIDPDIAASVFSATRLEREGEDLFELAARQGQEPPP